MEELRKTLPRLRDLSRQGSIVPRVGAAHTNAIGYATLDVVGNCATRSPADASYFTDDLLFDNVLTGDFQLMRQVGGWLQPPRLSLAGDKLVHIRAIPEGGAAGSRAFVNLPRTFYGGFSQAREDRRQPLPSVFALRYASSPSIGYSEVVTWREPRAPARGCNVAPAPRPPAPDFTSVRFDESENPTVVNYDCRLAACGPIPFASLPSTALENLDRAAFFPPDFVTLDAGGWLYLNLADPTDNSRIQAWAMMLWHSPAGSTSLPATMTGNGCSPPISERSGVGAIAPLR